MKKNLSGLLLGFSVLECFQKKLYMTYYLSIIVFCFELQNVTATAHVKIFDAKIRSNPTWHSNMLKVKDLPEKQSRRSEIAAREERTQETTEKTSISSVEHGIVPIPRRLTLPQ